MSAPRTMTRGRDADIDYLLDLIEAVTARVEALEAAQPAPRRAKHAEIDGRILEFFAAHSTLRFPAGAVAENLAEETRLVGNRIDSLARQGLIEQEKRDGKVRVYWHKPVALAVVPRAGA